MAESTCIFSGKVRHLFDLCPVVPLALVRVLDHPLRLGVLRGHKQDTDYPRSHAFSPVESCMQVAKTQPRTRGRTMRGARWTYSAHSANVLHGQYSIGRPLLHRLLQTQNKRESGHQHRTQKRTTTASKGANGAGLQHRQRLHRRSPALPPFRTYLALLSPRGGAEWGVALLGFLGLGARLPLLLVQQPFGRPHLLPHRVQEALGCGTRGEGEG